MRKTSLRVPLFKVGNCWWKFSERVGEAGNICIHNTYIYTIIHIFFNIIHMIYIDNYHRARTVTYIVCIFIYIYSIFYIV